MNRRLSAATVYSSRKEDEGKDVKRTKKTGETGREETLSLPIEESFGTSVGEKRPHSSLDKPTRDKAYAERVSAVENTPRQQHEAEHNNKKGEKIHDRYHQ